MVVEERFKLNLASKNTPVLQQLGVGRGNHRIQQVGFQLPSSSNGNGIQSMASISRQEDRKMIPGAAVNQPRRVLDASRPGMLQAACDLGLVQQGVRPVADFKMY